MQIKAEKHCDVTPDISLMKKMASTSGTIPSRIMELVDNAIDAKIEGKPLEVDVNVVKKGKKQYIEVMDNGCGMTEIVARSFFRLGDSKKQGQKKIGRFGLGSKVAILGIGDSCTVETVPYGEDYAIGFRFDIRQFRKWNVPYQVMEKGERSHGTKIRIDNVTIRIGYVERFCERLHEQFSKVYKHFIQHGDVVIRINGQNVMPTDVELLPGFYKQFDFMVDGKHVYGWCGAKKDTGANWKFGFDLIYNGRIIKQNDFLTRVPHQSLSRLTGEIHLDEFETDIHKTDFIRYNPSFEKMQEQLMGVEIADMLTNISKLTNREVFEKYHRDLKQVSNVLNKVLNSYEFLNQLDIETGIFKSMKSKKRNPVKPRVPVVETETTEEVADDFQDIFEDFAVVETEEVAAEQESVEEKEEKPKAPKKDSGLIVEEPIGVAAGYDQPPRRWVAFEKGDAMYLNVEVNIDHPFYANMEGERVAVQMHNAVLDSVAEFIVEEERKQVGFVEAEIERLNQLKDMLIRCSLTQ